MPLSFLQIYYSKTKFLQSYIDHIVVYNKRANFVRDVWLRAWRFWSTTDGKKDSQESLYDDWEIRKKIYFDRVRKHLDAHFTDEEMTIILAEKERLADLKRAERGITKDEQHKKEILRQRIRKLRFLEIRIMGEMGYSLGEIEMELGLTWTRIQNLLTSEKRKKKDKEIEYLLEVLKVVQG